MVFPERDPKVFWYAPTSRWVMILYGTGAVSHLHLHESDQLDERESPDPQQLRVSGLFRDDGGWESCEQEMGADSRQWSVLDRDVQRYSIHRGDATLRERFERRDVLRHAEFSPNTDTGDGRRIQMAWMRGSDFPNMPFNQQISFPCELSLKTTPKGLRLYRKPVSKSRCYTTVSDCGTTLPLHAGGSLALAESGDAFHIKARVQIPEGAKLTFNLRGVPVALTSRGARVRSSHGSDDGWFEHGGNSSRSRVGRGLCE